METDTEKELSVSQSAHNTEVGSVPEASSGETKITVETAKAIKVSKEDEQKDEAVENGNLAEENGEVLKENGEAKKEDIEPESVKENGEPTNGNGETEAGHEEDEAKENGVSNNENANTESTNENGEASEEVPSEQEATPVEDAGQTDADPSPPSQDTPATTSQEEGDIEEKSVETETPVMDSEEQEKQETPPLDTQEKAPTTEDPASESQEAETKMLETEETTQIDKVAEEVADVAVNEDNNTDEPAEKVAENISNPEDENQPDQLVTDDKVAEEMTEVAPTPEADVAVNDKEDDVTVNQDNNAAEPAVDASVPEESAEDNIKDELTTDEPVTEDAIDQVQVKIALNTDDMECVLENVAMVGDQVSNGPEHDPMEEDLESFATAPIPVKEEKSIDNQEQVLVDDEEMVITQITNLDELDPNVSVETSSDGQTKVIITTPVAPVEKVDIDQFTDTEDLVIYALDTISPFDAKFISQHMADRDEHQIERRLVDNAFRKKSFNFQKLPLMMFEMVFVSESNERMPSLMILTQRQLLQLTPKGSWCQYGPGIETIEMHFTNKTRFGIDTSALTEFIITNIPNMHMPYLR